MTDDFDGRLQPAYRSARFGNQELSLRIRRAQAIEEAREAARKPAVVFLGNTASGKSHLAAAALRYRTELDGRTEGKWMISAVVLAGARARHPLGEGEAPMVHAAMTAELLVLDNVGSDLPLQTNPIADIMQVRYDSALPTWVTTWMTLDDMSTRYGEGVSRRVFERARLIDCGGADWVKEYRK